MANATAKVGKILENPNTYCHVYLNDGKSYLRCDIVNASGNDNVFGFYKDNCFYVIPLSNIKHVVFYTED